MKALDILGSWWSPWETIGVGDFESIRYSVTKMVMFVSFSCGVHGRWGSWWSLIFVLLKKVHKDSKGRCYG